MKLRVYLAMAAMLIPALTFAVQKHTPGYICGFATSFNDSTVYFTDIQYMDSTYTDSKTGFLYLSWLMSVLHLTLVWDDRRKGKVACQQVLHIIAAFSGISQLR